MLGWTPFAAATPVQEAIALCLERMNEIGYEQDFHRPVYPIDKVDPLKFFSQAELDRAKERMHGWVEVLARTGQ